MNKGETDGYRSNMMRVIFAPMALIAVSASARGDDGETNAKGGDGTGGAASATSSSVTTSTVASASSAAGTGGGGGAPQAAPALTVAERAALVEQVAVEIDHMGFIGNTARDTGEHVILIRLPFSWSSVRNDIFCPDGCASGEQSFPPSAAFRTFMPEDARYEYTWEGAIGTLEGSADGELDTVPAWFHDTDPIEPNVDALFVVREHAEHVDIVAGEEDDTFVFTRTATKDFDMVLPGEVVRLAHTDETTLVGMVLEDGLVDAESLHYEGTFSALRDRDIVAIVDVDHGGAATGEVRCDGELIGRIFGQVSPDAILQVEDLWEADPEEPPSPCDAACGERACGLEPACGNECGACDEGLLCAPDGTCFEDPLAAR